MMKKNNSLEIIMEEINKCIKSDMTLAALYLALTIPDICGKILYPNLKGNGKSGVRYIGWFNKYIGDYEQSPLAKEDPSWADFPYMDGKTCYKLRCSLLHAGSDDLGKDIDIDEFVLMFGKSAILGSSGVREETRFMSDGSKPVGSKVKSLQVNVAELCKQLMWSAKAFLKKEVKEMTLLPTLNVIDIPVILEIKK